MLLSASHATAAAKKKRRAFHSPILTTQDAAAVTTTSARVCRVAGNVSATTFTSALIVLRLVKERNDMWFVAWAMLETSTWVCTGPMPSKEAVELYLQLQVGKSALPKTEAVSGLFPDEARPQVCRTGAAAEGKVDVR